MRSCKRRSSSCFLDIRTLKRPHSELFHFNPPFLAKSHQKMPDIPTDRCFSVSTLSYFQVEPLVLTNVPTFTLSSCVLLFEFVSFHFKGTVLLHHCGLNSSNEHLAHPGRNQPHSFRFRNTSIGRSLFDSGNDKNLGVLVVEFLPVCSDNKSEWFWSGTFEP